MKQLLDWESISYNDEYDFSVSPATLIFSEQVERAKVAGGWIVKNVYEDHSDNKNYCRFRTESMCFVPDTNEEWN